MRKHVALAIVLSMAAASSWALVGLEDVKFDGSLEVNGVSAKNEVDYNDITNDHRGGTNTRVRVGMDATVTEGVAGRFEIVRTNNAASQYGNGAQTLNNEQDNFLIQNAYIAMDDLLGLKVKLGRQYVGNPDDLVLYYGPLNDDNLTVNALDAISISKAFKFVEIGLMIGKDDEDDALANTDSDDGVGTGDINVNSLDIVLPTLIPGGKINLGKAWAVDENSSDSDDSDKLGVYRIGVNGGLQDNLITYRAEYLMNDGEYGAAGAKVDYKGNAIDLGVGANLKAMGDLGLAVNFVNASGDDNTTNTEDKAFQTISPGRFYGEIFGKSNTFAFADGGAGVDTGAQDQGLQIIHLGASYTPEMLAKLSVKVDFYDFSYAEDTVDNATAEDDIGTELDLTIGYKHSDNVKLEAGYAMLSPGDAVTVGGAAKDDAITKMFARAKVKWGGAE